MTGLSDAVGRKIILQHFPIADAATVEKHALWLSPPLVTGLSPYNFAKEGDQVEAQIVAFQRSIAKAWRAYQALPLHIRRGNGIDRVGFAKLARLASGVAIPGEAPIANPPAVKVMLCNAGKADRLSAQAMAAEHPGKIALVEKCRDAWRDLSGEEPPLKPSPGAPFLHFVQDVIEGAGRRGRDGEYWGAEKTLAAWRTAETNFAV